MANDGRKMLIRVVDAQKMIDLVLGIEPIAPEES